MKFTILSSSIRAGRKSDRVALYLKNYISEHNHGAAEIVDLKEYNFPLFDERLKNLENPDARLLEFAGKIRNAEAIIIVTPEYNGGYPASLKNVVDVLYEEWQGKPVAIASVSGGALGGAQVLTSLEFTLWKMGVTVVTTMFPVRFVDKSYREDGSSTEPIETDKAAAKFIGQILKTKV